MLQMTAEQSNGWRIALDNFARLLIAILLATVGFLYAEVRSVRSELQNHASQPSHPVMTERVVNLQRAVERIETKIDQLADDLDSIKKGG